MDYEQPNPYLYKFKGTIQNSSNVKTSLDNDNFVLRGSSLKNTEYVIGLAAYTG